MPQTRIEIEEHGVNAWTGEIEVGGITARRTPVRAGSFSEVMEQIAEVYYTAQLGVPEPIDGDAAPEQRRRGPGRPRRGSAR